MPLSKPVVGAFSSSDYGPIFQNDSADLQGTQGKRWLEDSLAVLNYRLPAYSSLRAIPLSPAIRRSLLKRSLDFLQSNQNSEFEKDNLKHVGRMISNMKIHTESLNEFLGIDSEDLQLLGALHDLGKAKVPVEMHDYLLSIFDRNDFLSLRVMPHELFSFFWIERLGLELGIETRVRELLMDQTANHNLGPDLSASQNAILLATDGQGRFRHWWVEHWSTWSRKVSACGLAVPRVYGHTVSPLANGLVLFDRIDGGHPHSWEKFLNQDLIAGHLKFTADAIVEVMEHANATSHEQLAVVGRELRKHFSPKHQPTPIEAFPPYAAAKAMLEKNDLIVDQLKACNDISNRQRMSPLSPNSILYSDKEDRWQRFDAEGQSCSKGSCYEFMDGKWVAVNTSDNPVALLLHHIYRDWQ